MILPTTYVTALLLTLLSMVCWGSWANTYKLTGKWRFELFYYDYSLGVFVAAVLIALTFGSLGNELGFSDDFVFAGYRKMAYCFAGGVVFNLANLLLVGAISVAGLAVAFPVGIGIALVIGVVWNYALNPQGNPALLFGGVALVIVAIVLDAAAYAVHARTKKVAAVEAIPEPVVKRSGRSSSSLPPPVRPPTPAKGIIISVVSGLLMGSFYPLVEMSKTNQMGPGLKPYSIGILFAAGVFLSTFLFNLYFLNLPIQGRPIKMLDYFKGKGRQHWLGMLGGAVWFVGAISNFLAASAPPEVEVGPAVSYAMGQGATMISALWGILVWKEFAGAVPRVRTLLTAMFVLFIAGLGMVSVAPLYTGK